MNTLKAERKKSEYGVVRIYIFEKDFGHRHSGEKAGERSGI